MKVQFNSINKSNQSIKLSVQILNKLPKGNKFLAFSYNGLDIFKYFLQIKQSKILVSIFPLQDLEMLFNIKLIGAFVYDLTNKYSATQIDINSNNKNILDKITLGFSQKDFTYSIYKKGSKKSNFKTNFKMSLKNNNLLKSINFLKELVSEPSNILYPESFTERTQKNINLSNVDFKILKEDRIKKLGLNCLLAVSQGSARKPRVMEF